MPRSTSGQPARSSARGRPRGRPLADGGDDTRSRIMAAARDCFARTGYAAATIAEIAERADVTVGAIYHYVDGKASLFAAVCDEMTRTLDSAFQSALSGPDNFIDRLCAVLDASSEIYEADPTTAMFASYAPVELQRHPELAAAVEKGPGVIGLQATIAQLVPDRADPESPQADIFEMLAAVLAGLSLYGAIVGNPALHRRAVVATERTLRRAGSGDATAPRGPDPEVEALKAENTRLKVLLAEAELEKDALRSRHRRNARR